jgi:primase-polymerase (primpol)-like protein
VLAWVPGAKKICSPPEAVEGAKTAFNTWAGLSPPPKIPKDWKKRAKPFVDHVAFLVPVKSERERFLQWLAHIIQRPEVLPHTYFLMTAKKTGIGRNLLSSMIVRVLRGHVAAGVALPELLDGGFTGRLSRKLLAIVDEAREGRR